MKRPGPVHTLLLVALVAAVALVLREGRREREDRRDVLRALRSAQGPVLPPAARSGAASATAPARYDRDRLYELVDGAAEAYLARGFTSCVAAVYAFGAPPGVEVAAEAHRFETEAGARAQLEAERPRSAAPVPGLAAVSDGQVLLAAAGRDLLKLTALSAGQGGREALVALATAWQKEMQP